MHRIPTVSAGARSRVMVAAVAVGAFAAAGAGQAASLDRDSVDTDQSPVDGGGATAALGVSIGTGASSSGGGMVSVSAPDLVLGKTSSATAEARKLAASQRIISKQAAERAEAKRKAELARLEALRPKFVKPAEGNFTSGFGARWGTTHYGIDLANSLGTPIVAAADGVILEAGPASGFGNWVRQQLPDGTILVYGHMQAYNVSAGQHVKAGDKIADMGSEGQSTGSHLHFEVWGPGGQKMDPLPWLAEHGINV